MNDFVRYMLYHMMAYGIISLLIAVLCVTQILKGISQRDKQVQLRKERARRRDGLQADSEIAP